MTHDLRLLVVNAQTLHVHPEGWRGDTWHDFADALGSHFKSATLLAVVHESGGEQFDAWPLRHVTVRSLPSASFVGVLRALTDRRARQAILQMLKLIREHDLVLTRIPDPFFLLIACCCRWHSIPLAVAVTGDVARSNRLAASQRWYVRVVGFVLGRLL